MTLQKLKEQVLRGSHISKEEAEWLAVQPDKEALYEACLLYTSQHLRCHGSHFFFHFCH